MRKSSSLIDENALANLVNAAVIAALPGAIAKALAPLAAALGGLGKGTKKRGRPAGRVAKRGKAPKAGKARKLPADINANLFHDAKKLADKEELTTANAVKNAAGIPMNVAAAIVAGKVLPLRWKTVAKLAKWTGTIIPSDIPGGAKKRGRKAKKQ